MSDSCIFLVDLEKTQDSHLREALSAVNIPVIPIRLKEFFEKFKEQKGSRIFIYADSCLQELSMLCKKINEIKNSCNISVVIFSKDTFKELISIGYREYSKKSSFQCTLEEDSNSTGSIEINEEKMLVIIDGRETALTDIEFRILCLLMGSSGATLSREKIISELYYKDYHISYRVIDVHVSALRKKLGKKKNQIVTVRGVGYRFKE